MISTVLLGANLSNQTLLQSAIRRVDNQQLDDHRSFYPRILERALREALSDTPVVCLLGPRQSGKTTLAQEFVLGRAFVSLDDDNIFKTAQADPAGFVTSLPEVVTLDEVQRVPELLPAIKRSVDRDRCRAAFCSPVPLICSCCRELPNRWPGGWRPFNYIP